MTLSQAAGAIKVCAAFRGKLEIREGERGLIHGPKPVPYQSPASCFYCANL